MMMMIWCLWYILRCLVFEDLLIENFFQVYQKIIIQANCNLFFTYMYEKVGLL